MIDKEVLQKCLHAVAYEIEMVISLALFIKGDFKIDHYGNTELVKRAIASMPVETRALHARNLAEFFMQPPRDGYIRASDYVDKYEAAEKDSLREIYKRACRYITHLTPDRINDVPLEKRDWPRPILLPLVKECGRFSEALLKTDIFEGEYLKWQAWYQEIPQAVAYTTDLLERLVPVG
jgi:hypothetical protein